MNFQGLKNVEDDHFYIDLAFRKAGEKSSIFRGSKKLRGKRVEKSSKIELLKIDVIKDVIAEKMTGIIKSFPDFSALPEFYQELVKCTIDYEALKKSLGAVKWARDKIISLHREYSKKIRRCRDMDKINAYRKEFYGRTASFMKQIRQHLNYLEQVRRTMKNYPSIKTGMRTVAIAGFPNVGKTTLLFKLTGSMPDIQPYAFTTKGINVSYLIKNRKKEVQLLDTPGTLNRFDKMNSIEKIAFLALKLLAEKIIYVFDITEPYPLKDQIKLCKKIKELKKPVLIYLSKTDMIEKKQAEDFAKKYKINNVEEIRNLLLNL